MSEMTEHEKMVEKQQLAEVMRLCVSDFSREVEARCPDGRTRTLFYHYDGLPEWLPERELGGHKHGCDYFTLVECLMYGQPDSSLYIAGERWVLAEYFVSSGETECPAMNDDEALEECPWSVEEREHEAETGQPLHRDEYYCRHCSVRYNGGYPAYPHRQVSIVKESHLDTSPDASEYRRDKCYYCEEKLGEPHGYIYIGDGWSEVVYRKDYRQWLLEKAIVDVWVQDGNSSEIVEFTDGGCAIIREKYVDEIAPLEDGLWEEFDYDIVDDSATSMYVDDWVKPRCSYDAKEKWLKLQAEALAETLKTS